MLIKKKNIDIVKNFVFGPVPSRRLGLSLGVDLVPFKTCSYDCIYCQLGRTTTKTIKRDEYVSISEIIESLKVKLSTKPDYITLSGSGEPTLYSKIGGLIEKIKGLTKIPVAVLTNGSLLWIRDVREQLKDADLILPSLDAGDETHFSYVNRPHPEISFSTMVDGLISFRDEFKGKIWLEVFLIDGVTGTESAIRKIAGIAKEINPDKIQLNTVTRPPTEKFAFEVLKDKLSKWVKHFGKNAEIIADFKRISRCNISRQLKSIQDEIIAMISRRPCTSEDISIGLSLKRDKTTKYIDDLMKSNKISCVRKGSKIFFLIKH